MIYEHLRLKAIVAPLQGTTRKDVIRELASRITDVYSFPTLDTEEIVEILLQRERLSSTGIGGGVAIPHARIPGIPELCFALGVSEQGIDFSAIDGLPSYVFFVLLAPQNSAVVHLKVLARICRLLKGTDLVTRFRENPKAGEIYTLLESRERQL